MQHEVQALLSALIAEQQRERELYQSLMASLSVASAARKRMLEDILMAASAAVVSDADMNRTPAQDIQHHLTAAVKRMADARKAMYAPDPNANALN